jgi:hypothetical protein
MATLNLESHDEPDVSRAKSAAYVRAIFDREMGVTLNNAKVGSPRDDAMRELTKTTINLYTKRVLRELIQNAFDGASGVDGAHILVRLDRREGPHGTLYVANSGQGFTVSNVDAIANPAQSNKKPGNFIGHKGLGFRSVELLSDDTQILSMANTGRVAAPGFDGFCFRFAALSNERAWLAAAGESAHAGTVVGRTHRLQLPLPMAEDPPDATQFARDGFATLVRMPLRDALAAERAAEEMRLLIDEKAPITLFLDRLSSLALESVDEAGAVDAKILARSGRRRRTSARGRGLVLEEVTVDKRRFLLGSMPVDEARFRASVELAVKRRHPVEKWLEWAGAPVVSVALPLSADARAGSFYAFLPMDTQAPFNGCLDAPFFPDADRRDLDISNPLNSFLLDAVADLCLAIAEEISDSEDTSMEMACAAVDALSWFGDPARMLAACERAGVKIGDLRLPCVRRKGETSRWARLEDIYDWDDAAHKIIDGASLVRACNVPMLRRGLGPKRLEALYTFVEKTEFRFSPPDSNWTQWGPELAADLARRKVSRQSWEHFYADLADMPDVLPHLCGTRIFRLTDGSLGDANSPETPDQRELFISPEAESGARTRRRLAGTTLFPPGSVTQRMVFVDTALAWSPTVANAMFTAGLATEYSLSKVLSGMGRLLGSRPTKTVALAGLQWAFTAWKAHKSAEIEKALKVSGLQVPVVGGGSKPAGNARFGAGWRDTQGDLLAELCGAASDTLRGAKTIRESLLIPWDEWPLKDRGTGAEWLTFLKLIGVRDGLWPFYYKALTLNVWTWRGMQGPLDEGMALEKSVGPQWRQALQPSTRQPRFTYQSGTYSSDETLYRLPLQGEHAEMPTRAKLAYARLVMAAMAEHKESFLTTTLRRTSGNSDFVRWPSPLSAFLRDAAWMPVIVGEGIEWSRPRDCWFAPRSDPMPRFVPRIDHTVRDALDASAPVRDLFAKHFSLGLWIDRASAVKRLSFLGQILAAGIGETDHDSLRKAYRDAWLDWYAASPRPPLPERLTLAVQAAGRLVALKVQRGEGHPPVFVGEGTDPTLENLLVSLGHNVLSVPSGAAEAATQALDAAIGGEFRLGKMARPTIIVDSVTLDLSGEAARLAGEGRDWLAEISVLVLEFNVGFSNRATTRTRQSLFDAFKRLRIMFARSVRVEIDGRVGDLPAELDGVLPVPNEERPTVVVQSASGALDWPTLTRISRGIAVAIDRSWLLTDMRMAFLAIASGQAQSLGTLERPSDEAVARAFGQPVERVREVYRSLRATSSRLFEFLIPVVQARHGGTAAQDLLRREHLLADDSEVVLALIGHGFDAAAARALIDRCREANSLDDLRRDLGIDLGIFNAALIALGPPWEPLRFDKELRRTFSGRVAERRAELEQRVRDAYLQTYDAGQPLTGYNTARALQWLTFDEAWLGKRDELDNTTIDVHIDALCATVLPVVGDDRTLSALDVIRHHNRSAVIQAADELRKLVGAWVAKDLGNRAADPAWRTNAEQIAREVMSAGALDFRRLERADLPAALSLAGLWPAGMPRSLALDVLGLAQTDLEHQAREDKKAQDAELKRRRTVTIGGVDVDGGVEGAFQAVADALQAAVAGKEFLARSGPANLRELPEGDTAPSPRRRGKAGGKDPEYMSEERRTLIGFAGEFAAYQYLSRNVRNFADEHWISSIGRRFLALPATQDDEGFDFRVPRTRGDLHFEVKAHEGDPGHVDLERSQVAAAVAFADGKKGTWSILYVAYATDPSRITVHELPNPFGQAGLNRYRPSTRQGVRLIIDRQ